MNEAEKSSFFVYASSEKNRMLACRFGEHRDNSRNSQSVFLVVLSCQTSVRRCQWQVLQL